MQHLQPEVIRETEEDMLIPLEWFLIKIYLDKKEHNKIINDDFRNESPFTGRIN